MSLKFVTRKLKTQTLGDDDGEQGSDNGTSSTRTKSFSNSLNEDKNTVMFVG